MSERKILGESSQEAHIFSLNDQYSNNILTLRTYVNIPETFIQLEHFIMQVKELKILRG